jgi:hypothetical protein
MRYLEVVVRHVTWFSMIQLIKITWTEHVVRRRETGNFHEILLKDIC